MSTPTPDTPPTRSEASDAFDTSRPVRIIHLFHRYLNIYADRGNIAVLRGRLERRGLSCEVHGHELGETFEPGDFDLVYVGGGQDREQAMIAQRMRDDLADAIRGSVERDAALLAVCGGYQLLGRGYRDTTGTLQPGCELFDHETTAGTVRLIGNVTIEAALPAIGELEPQLVLVAGFENHAGRTVLGPDALPLGRVVHGYGNDGESGFEGCVTRRAIGTYLHGPLLPRNPELADWLLGAALAHAHGDDAAAGLLTPIADPWAERAREVLAERAAAERRIKI